MNFLRHEEIYRSDGGLSKAGSGNSCRCSQCSSAAMSFQSVIPWQVTLRQSAASASPTGNDSQRQTLPYNDFAANGNYLLNFMSQSKGALPARTSCWHNSSQFPGDRSHIQPAVKLIASRQNG
jgi:hypothetical protein